MGAAIEIDHVSKHFKLNHERPTPSKERVVNFRTAQYEEFWALRDVTFRSTRARPLGLLGHNGSGKSTLLKCVAGIMRPTEGSIRQARPDRRAARARRRLPPRPHRARERLHERVDPRVLRQARSTGSSTRSWRSPRSSDFIDNQVKHYSSGMDRPSRASRWPSTSSPRSCSSTRCSSVGDEAFQRKCLDRIKRFQREGRTILLVTHAVDLVRQICDRAAVLDHGELVAVGPPGEAVLRVPRAPAPRAPRCRPTSTTRPLRRNLEVKITDVRIVYPVRRSATCSRASRSRSGSTSSRPSRSTTSSSRSRLRPGRQDAARRPTPTSRADVGRSRAGRGRVRDRRLPLMDGIYPVHLGAHTRDGGRPTTTGPRRTSSRS